MFWLLFKAHLCLTIHHINWLSPLCCADLVFSKSIFMSYQHHFNSILTWSLTSWRNAFKRQSKFNKSLEGKQLLQVCWQSKRMLFLQVINVKIYTMKLPLLYHKTCFNGCLRVSIFRTFLLHFVHYKAKQHFKLKNTVTLYKVETVLKCELFLKCI